MAPEEQIPELIKVIEESPEGSEDIYISRLMEHGASYDEARDVYRFTQIAFGRYLLKDKGIAFSDEFWCFTEMGEHIKTDLLRNVPAFCEAERLASLGMSQPVILALVFTSPEVRAVNDLLNRGSKTQDVDLAPVLLFSGRPSEEAINKAAQKKRQSIKQHRRCD